MQDRPAFGSWESAVVWLRQQPDQRQLVLDCYYDDPLLRAAQRYFESEEWRAISHLLGKRSGQALDIGAGRGIVSYALAKAGYSVTALEPDPSDIVGGGAIRGLAAQARLPIDVVRARGEHLPFADGQFNVVVARAVLHHAHDLERSCSECRRVLRPGGLFVATREHVVSSDSDVPRFQERHPLHRIYGGEHAFTVRRYTSALKSAGFAHVAVLAPWSSEINMAPRTLSALRAELARRISLSNPVWGRIVERCLSMPAVWLVAAKVLNLLDRRPGRLFTFVASR